MLPRGTHGNPARLGRNGVPQAMKERNLRTKEELSACIRRWAMELGFDGVGIAPAGQSEQGSAYQNWAEAGMAGEMGYLTREDAIAKRRDPSLVVPEARSAVVVAMNYYPEDEQRPIAEPSRGIVARYARNDDYHELLKPRLIALQERISSELLPVGGRAYVDTGPLLERELARRAGLGWQARNTMLIRPGKGSYCFLGVILLDIELACDEPFDAEHCGTCTSCVDHCPTGALLGRDESGAPRMDARRCISYLTIELKGPMPRELRPLIGNRIYGCDICQEVCPHSLKFSSVTEESSFWPRAGVHGSELTELMSLSQEEFSRRFKGSPVKRAKRRGLLRNVAVALGNWGSPAAVPVLSSALSDEEPLVRGHSAWALGRIAYGDSADSEVASEVAGLLVSRLALEEDAWVREELALALAG